MPSKYIAEVRNVREVCLVGCADLDFWTEQLAPEGASPADINGHAEVWISAVQLKWLSINFKELSIALRLKSDVDTQSRIFLVSAFNTSRMLAWCERTFFQTPYQHATITLHAARPWSFELRHADHLALSANSHGVTEVISSDESWVGKILLPTNGTRGTRKFFYAQLSGRTEVVPFDLQTAQLTLHPNSHHPIVNLLAKSHFRPKQWRVRTNATHARSKTYRD